MEEGTTLYWTGHSPNGPIGPTGITSQDSRFKKILVYCCPSTVPFLWPPSPSSPSQCKAYTDSVWLWGGVEMYCGPYRILQEFYTLFLTRFRTYKTASPPLTKMTSKDDIKGLVSLKFLRPWWLAQFLLTNSDHGAAAVVVERKLGCADAAGHLHDKIYSISITKCLRR